MPPIVQRWLALIGVALTLFGVGFVKGCEHERDKWETLSAQAEAEAEKVTAERIRKQQNLVAKYEKERNDANASAARSRDAVRSLRDTIANMPRSPLVPVSSEGSPKVGDVLGECAERYSAMAGTADELYGKAQLGEALYESIRKRKKE